MPTDEQILARKAARSAAATIAELALGEVGRLSPDAQVAFYEELAKRLPLPVKMVSRNPIEPFTDTQSRAWGAQRMRFGKYIGQRIDEIPMSYLETIVEPNTFTQSLQRYLASHRVAVEQEQAEQHA